MCEGLGSDVVECVSGSNSPVGDPQASLINRDFPDLYKEALIPDPWCCREADCDIACKTLDSQLVPSKRLFAYEWPSLFLGLDDLLRGGQENASEWRPASISVLWMDCPG